MARKWFQRGYRRMLVDMHIPDWDPEFLSRYDPAEMVRLYEEAGLTSVMFYAQSHVGLCYWPTKTGAMHAGLKGRDIVGETVELLREAGMDVCAYYSVVYNNWAHLEHPEWRLVSAAAPDSAFNVGRYGHCCPNNPGYRAFALAQVEELVGAYRFDGLFIDMTFWTRICVCEHCRARLRDECGTEVPDTIDWFSPDWCSFQAARERWMREFARELSERAKEAGGGLSVYHNFATAMGNWTLGLSLQATEANDFLGADFYRGPVEQLFVSKLMNNLSNERPIEFMTSRCLTLSDHETNKTRDDIRMLALTTTLFGAAMLFIDAINPDGTVNPGTYELVREVYDEMSRYEPFLGGEPVEDVAVYFSSESKMDFTENGTSLAHADLWNKQFPHRTAVQGVCGVLQRAHVPFGVITRKQLAGLDRYKVVVLPNVLRMDEEEAAAFREYVRRGGRLYASRFTSLTETCGVRHIDFMLADVFGCHVENADAGQVTYINPCDAEMARAVAPQAYMSCVRPWLVPGSPAFGGHANGTIHLTEKTQGDVLATLTLPYAAECGTVDDQDWSSIHSTPPWRDTNAPVIVSHRFGEGRSIYSATDMESLEGQVNDRVLLGLLRRLLSGRESASAQTHPCVWMTVTDQPDEGRMIVGFLNRPPDLPPVPIAEVPFTLRPPEGKRFVRLQVLPDGETIEFSTDEDGVIAATVSDLEALVLLAAEYE